MPLHVYRSLDRSSTLFGIKGSFIAVLGILSVAWALLGLIFGLITEMIVMLIVWIVGTALSYGLVMYLQSKLSERDLKRNLAGRKIPDFLIYYPVESLMQGQHADTEKGKGSS